MCIHEIDQYFRNFIYRALSLLIEKKPTGSKFSDSFCNLCFCEIIYLFLKYFFLNLIFLVFHVFLILLKSQSINF